MAQDAFDAALLDSVKLIDIVAELRRELGMREHKYPQWVQAKSLKPEAAQRQMLRMRAALHHFEKAWADEQAKAAPALPFEGPAGAAKAPGDRGHR